MKYLLIFVLFIIVSFLFAIAFGRFLRGVDDDYRKAFYNKFGYWPDDDF